MPVSVMKFLTVKAPATSYHLILFEFGGAEKFFADCGFSTSLGHVAGIVLGANSALLVDTLFARGDYAVEKAGYANGELMAAWEWITRHFDNLPENGVMIVERNADSDYGWSVKSVELVETT